MLPPVSMLLDPWSQTPGPGCPGFPSRFQVGSSVPEMPHSGEGHGQISLIRGGDDFGVPHGTTRLDGGRGTSFRRRDQPIRKGEEGVAADDAAL